ncbi:MAG TPA: 3-hydroxyacyl-CoA dehydrogenase [Pseudohongiella sp.]|nr:3-hydroxyacyl-CoA dehydrogenase [Pseudohongiella sp.]|tara:strand:+ start:545 stop:1309 length:765 start_codon:yes stop_codon:yes gene_type:complete
MEIQEKTAFVTGAASGLGLAATRALVAGGAKVLMFDRDEERLLEAAASVAGEVAWQAGDITDEQSVQRAVDSAIQQFGGLHININCAGIGGAAKTVGRDGPMPLDMFRRIVDVNLIGTFNVLRLCAAAMCQRELEGDADRGVIINVASVAAFDGQRGQAAYSAAKGGLVGMTLPIARDLARDQIRIMTVAPGVFSTPMMQAAPEQVRDALVQSIQYPKRMGLPEEFADLALSIVRNRYLNGEVIRLDGGVRMPP